MVFFIHHSFGIEYMLLIALAVLLLASTYTDMKSQRIPNYLTVPSMVAGIILYSVASGFDGFLFSLKGISIGIGILLIPYLMGSMGAGDAKLMGAVGGFLGAKGVFGAFLLTAVMGGAYALFIILVSRTQFKSFFKTLWHRNLVFKSTLEYTPEPEDSQAQQPQLCYGLAITLGTVSYMLINYMGYSFIS